MENGKQKQPGTTSQGESKGTKLVKKETEVCHTKAREQHVILTVLTKGDKLLLCALRHIRIGVFGVRMDTSAEVFRTAYNTGIPPSSQHTHWKYI